MPTTAALASSKVQRVSGERARWTRVGFVQSTAAGGTTTAPQSYQFAADGLPAGPHRFPLKQVDLEGGSTRTDPIRVTVEMRAAVTLTSPAPNPASTHATRSFAVRERAETTITLYNTPGQRVATVYEGTPPAGEQQTTQFDVTGAIERPVRPADPGEWADADPAAIGGPVSRSTRRAVEVMGWQSRLGLGDPVSF